MRTENGMRIITDSDYKLLQDIKAKWKELHGSYFKVGKRISEITSLFDKMGKDEK